MWIDLTREQCETVVESLKEQHNIVASDSSGPLDMQMIDARFLPIVEEIENKLGMSQAQSQATDRPFLYDNMG